MPLLLIGCDGGTNATSGVVPEITRKLYDLTLAGRLEEARRVQYDLVTLIDTMIYSAEFPNGFRAAASLRGFQLGEGRQPMSPEQKTDLVALSKTLQCLLSEHGFTDQPVGGCPVGRSAVSGSDRVEIDAIVRNVVAELKRRGLA